MSPTECPMQWWLPPDDHPVMKWEVRWNPERPLTLAERHSLRAEDPGGFVEPTSDPYTHFRPQADRTNDYFLDYEAQLPRCFSGVPSVNLQDKALVESLGQVADRTREHLGIANAMIIRTR